MSIVIMILLFPIFLTWLVRVIPAIEPSGLNALLASILVILLVCPLTIGYGFVLLGVGYIYGWMGLPLLYVASVIGGCLWFQVTRTLSHRWNLSSRLSRHAFTYIPSLRSYTSTIDAVSSTFDQHGLKVCCLLQLGFLPYGLLNTLLSFHTNVRFLPDFLISTLVSRLKIINYVWIATTFKDIAQVMGTTKREIGINGTCTHTTPHTNGKALLQECG